MKLKKKALALLLAACLPFLYLLLQLITGLAGMLLFTPAWAQENTTLLLLIAALLLILLLSVLFRLARNPLSRASGFAKHAPTDVCLLAALAGICGNTLCSLLLPLVPFPQSWLAEYEEVLAALSAGSPVVQWLTIGLVVPAAEEILFRGLMIPVLENAFSARTALGIHALLFALFHGDKIQFLYVLGMSFLLGLAFQWSRSLRVSLLMHIAFNCFSLAVIIPLGAMSLPMYMACLFLVFCLTVFFMRALRGKYRDIYGA